MTKITPETVVEHGPTRRSNLLKLALVTIATMLGAQADATPSAQAYAAGQVWEYRSRPQDTGSLIKIWQVENASTGPIYHIGLSGIKPAVINDQIYTFNFVHLPMSKQSLDQSVTRQSTSKAEFVPIESGIAEWRSANGGVFTISIAQALDFAESTIREQAPQTK